MFDNYVFDLYGTLIDIHTNEHLSTLWQTMAQLYSVYGADYDSVEMEMTFFALEKQARDARQAMTGSEYPEIRYEPLFVQLLVNAPVTHPVSTPVSPKTAPHLLMDSDWVRVVANIFRIASRKYIRLFPGVVETLKALRQRGKHLYLLSNAQAVFTRPELEQLGLPPLLDDMFLSSDYGVMKPDPRFLKTLMKKHGLDPQRTLMVGDDFHADAGVALRCGVHAALLNTHHNEADVMKRYRRDALNRCHVEDESMIRLILTEPCLPELLCD